MKPCDRREAAPTVSLGAAGLTPDDMASAHKPSLPAPVPNLSPPVTHGPFPTPSSAACYA